MRADFTMPASRSEADVTYVPASNFRQVVDVDRLVLDAEAVAETAQTRQRANERDLAALEADAPAVTGAGLLALDAAAGVVP